MKNGTDLFFFGELLIQKHTLTSYAMLFLFAPHILSLIIMIIYVLRYKYCAIAAAVDNLHKEWIASHALSLICMTLFSNLYGSIELSNCKLFHCNLFNMQISSRSRHKCHIIHIVFEVVIGSFPMMIIEMAYMSLNEYSHISIAATAMIFSFISIACGIFIIVSKLCNNLVEYLLLSPVAPTAKVSRTNMPKLASYKAQRADLSSVTFSVALKTSRSIAINDASHDSKQTKTHCKRLYHSWEGNNTICCAGRIIGGPQKRYFFYTLILIIIPSITFMCFVSVDYIYSLIIYSIVLMITVISFTLTAFSDPGIIPRGILPPRVSYKGPAHVKQRLCVSGALVEFKWCVTCRIFRPPRAVHCRICNNCVERFDHHCPWIGNCIGSRNYAYFFLFVNSLQILWFWAFSHCIKILYLRATTGDVAHKSSWKQFTYAVEHELFAFLTGIYVFIGIIYAIGLAAFHWFLVCVGKTTNEQLRNLHPAGSPFKRSCCGNIIDHCCQFPATSIHLNDVAPTTTSYNELYVNKQKVVLLGNAAVNKHHRETHSKHIHDNSPFKAYLLKNFGYKELVKLHPINDINAQKNGNDAADGKEEEEAMTNNANVKEENKYDTDDDKSFDPSSKSQSRNDGNVDQQRLYIAYDDENGIDAVQRPTEQHSLSVISQL